MIHHLIKSYESKSAVTAPRSSLLVTPVAVAATLRKVVVFIPGAVAEQTTFNCRLSNSLATVSVLAGVSRITVAAGGRVGFIDSLNVSVSEFDLLKLDLETLPSAGFNSPVFVFYELDDGVSLGSGDMLKSTYDTTNNGIIDNSEKLNNQTSGYHLDRANHTGTQLTDTTVEGTNLYLTAARVLAVLMTGISFVTSTAVVATDSILIAVGKLQKQITDNITSISANTTAIAGKIAGAGTANKIIKFTAGTTGGDSNISDDGTDITLNDKTISRASAKIRNTTTTAENLALTDNGMIVTFSNAGAVAVNIPVACAFVGFTCTLVWKGVGQPTLNAGTSVTFKTSNPTNKLRAQNSFAFIACLVANEITVGGDMAQS